MSFLRVLEMRFLRVQAASLDDEDEEEGEDEQSADASAPVTA